MVTSSVFNTVFVLLFCSSFVYKEVVALLFSSSSFFGETERVYNNDVWHQTGRGDDSKRYSMTMFSETRTQWHITTRCAEAAVIINLAKA